MSEVLTQYRRHKGLLLLVAPGLAFFLVFNYLPMFGLVLVFNLTVLGLVGLMALYPFVYTISMSLSSAEALRASLHLYPRDISLTSYRMVLSNPEIVTGFTNSVLRTVLGTALTLFLLV